MNNNNKPVNLFATKHFLSIIALFYITTISPAIDNLLENNLSKQERAKILNALVVSAFAASLKAFDKDVYTPDGMPGRSKDKALNNINESSLPTTTDVKDAVIEAVENVVNNNINNTNSSLDKSVNSFISDNSNNDKGLNNNTVKALLPNIVEPYIQPVIATNSNNILDNNISDLFKTSNVLIQKDVEMKPTNNYKYGNEYHPNLLINKLLTNTVLTAKEDTFYKFEPVDSSTLLHDKKIKVDSAITIYIDSYDLTNLNDHISFKINDTTLYAYIPHISIIDNNIATDYIVDLSTLTSKLDSDKSNTNKLLFNNI